MVWLSYPRGVIVSLIIGIWTLIMSVVVFTTAMLTRRRSIIDFTINRMWCDPLIGLPNVKVDLRGAEQVSGEKKGFLLLFNHSSHMDIPVLYAYFPRSFRFGAKIELFKIPLFGRAMRQVGVLPIDRRNRNEVMRIYKEAIARVENGECFALAPEGTRQPEPVLGPFKRGPFEFAINARMDIVPVVLAGTYNVLPRGKLWINQGRWSRTIIMQILPRVRASDYTIEQSKELMERVRAQMLPVHAALHAELAE